jgi:hypothetical protein
LGLAQLSYIVKSQIPELEEIQLTDLGTSYRIQFKTEIDPEEVAKNLNYGGFLKPVKGDKTEAISGLDWSDIDYFDTKQNSEKRNRWREYQRQRQREKLNLAEDDTPSEPDARTQNGTILTSMRHDRNHNALYKAQWEIQDDFGALVAAIFKAFADSSNVTEGNAIDRVAKYFQDYTGKSLPSPASAVKIFLPTCVQGVNRPKADNNKADSSQKEDWVLLWLIATGLFEFGVAERIKVAEGTYDWRMVALEPKAINLFQYRKVLDELRKFNPPSGTHFGSKGQVYGVKEIFSLGIPDWIRPDNAQEVKSYQELLTEHLAVVKSLSADEGNGELLTAYRDFITGSDLHQFFRFHLGYADYIVRQLADPQAKFAPKQFSQTGLNIMTQSFDKPDQNWSVTEITQNQGFQRIARAINSATVYAGKIKTKQGVIELDWQRIYGLAQRLGNHAGSKKDFIAELSAFLTNYENENLRISEQLQKEGKSLKRVWVTNEDLEQFLALLDDKRFSCSLVANLLLAYGYSKWKKPLKEEAKDTPIVEDDNVEDNN